MIRNPAHADEVGSTGATPSWPTSSGSIPTIAGLIAGHDAVVWSAGAGGGDPARTMAVDRDAAVRAMDAASRAGVRRFVMVSYFGSSPQHGVDPGNPFWHYAEAKAAADEHLRASDLDWTVLGPSTLTLEPSNGCIDATAERSGSVSRAAVAEAIAAALADDFDDRAHDPLQRRRHSDRAGAACPRL